jgi:hypothetical protein
MVRPPDGMFHAIIPRRERRAHDQRRERPAHCRRWHGAGTKPLRGFARAAPVLERNGAQGRVAASQRPQRLSRRRDTKSFQGFIGFSARVSHRQYGLGALCGRNSESAVIYSYDLSAVRSRALRGRSVLQDRARTTVAAVLERHLRETAAVAEHVLGDAGVHHKRDHGLVRDDGAISDGWLHRDGGAQSTRRRRHPLPSSAHKSANPAILKADLLSYRTPTLNRRESNLPSSRLSSSSENCSSTSSGR